MGIDPCTFTFESASETVAGTTEAAIPKIADCGSCPRCGAVSPSLGTRNAIEPFAISKRDTHRMVGMPKLVQRWHYHGWIVVVRQGGRGRETMYDFQSVKQAYERFKRGEKPPPLPSEL